MTDDILEDLLDTQQALTTSLDVVRERLDEMERRDYEAWLASEADKHSNDEMELARQHEHLMMQTPGFAW